MSATERPASRYSVTVFAISAVLLFAGLEHIGQGQITIGHLCSGLLYLAYGLALTQNHILAYAKHWWAAALPVVIAPIGVVALLLTIWVTVSVRKAARSN